MDADSPPDASRRRVDAAAHVFARRYGDALRAADPAATERVVEDALAAGMDPADIHTRIIQPAMVRIGELWEINAITVADEHLATAISHGVLIKLIGDLTVSPPRSRERILLAAVEGQAHVLGLRMIADVLEGAGFDVLYLGADVPVFALSRFAADQQPAVVGLAFEVSVGIGELAESILSVQEACPDTRIMLGGRAVPPGLTEAGYPVVGNSAEVVQVVERLLRGPAQSGPPILDLLTQWAVQPSMGPVRGSESDAVAERLAGVAEDAAETAREYIRRAEAFRDLAFRDPVTDLGNRRAFDDRLHERVHGRRGETGGVLLMIDVDAFKGVNDSHGHQAGDQVLRFVGRTIARMIRGQDFAARVGGDEFAVLLPTADMEEARQVGERIGHAVAADSDPPVTVSIGVAPLGGDARGVVLAADLALYGAKGAGRDRVVGAPAQPLVPGSTSVSGGR